MKPKLAQAIDAVRTVMVHADPAAGVRRGDRGESCTAALANRRAEFSRDPGGRHLLPGCRGVSPCPAPLLAGFNGDDPPAHVYEQRVPRS
jgi:hypothetical protein